MAAPGMPPMRGRDSELATVGRHLDRLLAGVGSVLVIEGRAGMGKSRLVGEVAAMARRLAITVGSGVADPGGSVVQLSVLMEALVEGPTPIVDRDSLGDAHTSLEQRYWLLQDIEALLERATRQAPVLICLDDLHWADSGTAAALRVLPARLATVPVGWVIALRPGQRSPELQAVLDELVRSGAETIVLGPLDDGSVAQVAADVLAAEPDVPLLELAGRAGGVPFLLVELLWGLREEQLVRVGAGRAELVASTVPHRVSETMRHRLERMSGPARQAATVAAALGRRFTLTNLAVMLEQPPAAVLAPVEELTHCGVLVERDDQLAFRHDLTLEAVRDSLSVPVRRALDRQAAVVLFAAGALPVEVATQLAASAEPGDEFAITTLMKAAEALGATDPGTAADLGRRALELAPSKHPLRGPLVAETAVWLHAAARGEEAKAFADTALREVLPPAQEAEVRLSIAGMFAISPDVRAESSRQALALPRVPVDLRARHQAHVFHNLVVAGRFDSARNVLEPTRTEVRRCADVAGQFVLEFAESGLDYAEERFADALVRVEAALRTGLDAGDETRSHLAHQWRCDVLAAQDRFDEALQLSAESVARAQRDRQGWALTMFETARGRLLLQLGRLSDAMAILEDRFTPDTAHQVVSVMDAAGVVALGRGAMHTGDQGQLRFAAQIAHVMLGQTVPSVRRHAAWMLALHAMAGGDPGQAHRWLCVLGEDERTAIVPLFPMDVTDEARLVHIALAARDDALAAAAVATASRRARGNPDVASIAAAAAHAKGLVDGNRKDLAEAVELYELGPRPLALASALEDLGVHTVEDGDADDAIDLFSRALVLLAEAGAIWDAGRVRGRLRALGVRRRLVPAQRPDRGWAAMTESELAVARLVAEGLTNREVADRLFVSHHTVSGHLRRVFAKLDVNSRVDLTRLASTFDPQS